MRDLWLVRLSNTRNLNIVQIQKIEDLLKELESQNYSSKQTFLFRYLTIFPLIIACTIKVKHPAGNFKPEYIIPQLLLQYVSKNDEIDGIKFPSTKVNYSKLTEVEAYNYVFPVKKVASRGLCEELTNTFHSTEPTSLEIEELMFNPQIGVYVSYGKDYSNDHRTIELINGITNNYYDTSFGNIEEKLGYRPLYKL